MVSSFASVASFFATKTMSRPAGKRSLCRRYTSRNSLLMRLRATAPPTFFETVIPTRVREEVFRAKIRKCSVWNFRPRRCTRRKSDRLRMRSFLGKDSSRKGRDLTETCSGSLSTWFCKERVLSCATPPPPRAAVDTIAGGRESPSHPLVSDLSYRGLTALLRGDARHQTLPPFGPAAGKDRLPGPALHPGPKPMCSLTFNIVRLICSLHQNLPLGVMRQAQGLAYDHTRQVLSRVDRLQLFKTLHKVIGRKRRERLPVAVSVCHQGDLDIRSARRQKIIGVISDKQRTPGLLL